MNACNNNLNKPYTTAKTLHKPSGYSLLTSCSFDKSENKPTFYRGKDKSYVIYVKKNFVPIIIKKCKKLEIIVTIQGNIEALHIVSVI